MENKARKKEYERHCVYGICTNCIRQCPNNGCQHIAKTKKRNESVEVILKIPRSDHIQIDSVQNQGNGKYQRKMLDETYRTVFDGIEHQIIKYNSIRVKHDKTGTAYCFHK